tara:strand:+ start:866 stop:2281 length:1416 start_codon:yes stop_codon:yes gene_type:complete
MAIVIDIEPAGSKICSTLIPLVLEVTETTSNTTNIIASCYWTDQTSSTETQIGAKYRLAPNLANADKFIFDCSEIFNSLTKYTLNDAPNNFKLGANVTAVDPLGISNWKDIATWKVRVKFQREYLDATTGLIVLDPTFTNSNYFYIHEGSPEQKWLTQIVKSNGQTDSVFDAFRLSYQTAGQMEVRRLLTNYPIFISNSTSRSSNVTIHESEQYLLSFFPNLSIYDDYRIMIGTQNFAGALINAHSIILNESQNLFTACVGFRDLKNSFTPNALEGTDFINVGSYVVIIQSSNTVGGGGTYLNQSTNFNFKVDRSCIKNVGYLRFCFKNMLGGFDMVTSRGKYNKKVKNKFSEFEQSLGYYSWTESESFGNSNWANENAVRYSVKTQPMKPENAAHFSEMFSSTDVYLREANNSSIKILDNVEALNSINVPYKFNSIFITAGSQTILKSDNNLVVLEFEFTMSVNQRNPRY